MKNTAEILRTYTDNCSKHLKCNLFFPELEKTIKPFYTTKGVRLDVYLKDEDKIIDVELQTYKQDAIGKRTRYYQSMIDIDSLMKGQDYSELLDSYVLFICNYDPFEKEKDVGFGLLNIHTNAY